MQRIVIHHFGPIREIDLPIRELTILIGPNASGKSLVGRLMYFFKSLPKICSDHILGATLPGKKIQEPEDFIEILKHKTIPRKFKDFFGYQEFVSTRTKIEFQFGANKILTLVGSKSGEMKVEEESNTKLFTEVHDFYLAWKKERENQGPLPWAGELAYVIPMNSFSPLYRIFHEEHIEGYWKNLFIPDDRASAKLAFSEIYWRGLRSNNQIAEEKPGYRTGANPLIGQVDVLLEEYVSNRYTNDLLEVFGGFKMNPGDHPFWQDGMGEKLYNGVKLFAVLLKGVYNVERELQESIYVNGKKIPLPMASSGQQEIVAIASTILANLRDQTPSFTVIEEPEAHLFPVEQAKLAKFLMYCWNAEAGNQMVLTTHSPYLLTVLNNLLLAFKVGQEEVEDIVPRECWVNPEKLSVYHLEDGVLTSLLSERGLVQAEGLDGASDDIGDEFDKIMEIYRKKGAVAHGNT